MSLLTLDEQRLTAIVGTIVSATEGRLRDELNQKFTVLSSRLDGLDGRMTGLEKEFRFFRHDTTDHLNHITALALDTSEKLDRHLITHNL